MITILYQMREWYNNGTTDFEAEKASFELLKVDMPRRLRVLHRLLQIRTPEIVSRHIQEETKKLGKSERTFCPTTPIWHTPHRRVKFEVSV